MNDDQENRIRKHIGETGSRVIEVLSKRLSESDCSDPNIHYSFRDENSEIQHAICPLSVAGEVIGNLMSALNQTRAATKLLMEAQHLEQNNQDETPEGQSP